MSLKPMGPVEILITLIDKDIKDMELIKQEVYATLPRQKRQVVKNEIIDPRTGKPFVLKRPKPFDLKKTQPITEG